MTDATMQTEKSPEAEVVPDAMTFYQELAAKLQEQGDASEIRACLADSSKEIQEKTNEVFSASKLTDELSKNLLQGDNEKTLMIVQMLAQIDGSTYLPALAVSVVKTVKEYHADGIDIKVSDPLLHLWMQQLTHSDSVSVHSNLLEALVLLSSSQTQSDDILFKAMDMLVEIWKTNQSADSKESSIVSVRCATLWIQWLEKLGGKAVLERSQEAQDLFLNMLKGFDDPLQQLTMMDLLIEHFGTKDDNNYITSTSASANTMDIDRQVDEATQTWLASPALLSPILQMLQDPILSGAALHYLSGVLVTLRPSDVETVLEHIRQVGVVSNETERLQIVHAMTNLAPMAAQKILQDTNLRHAWWDITRLTQSKLQAAILVSVALTLPELPSSTGMKLYNAIGPDNSTGSNDLSTTQWLMERFVASPIQELRVAAYALLAAMLKLDNAPNIMALSTPKEAQASLLEHLMDPQKRENNADARLAYFDVVSNLHDLLDAENGGTNVWVATMNADHLVKVKQQLQKKIQLGPHGREPQRWDVATE